MKDVTVEPALDERTEEKAPPPQQQQQPRAAEPLTAERSARPDTTGKLQPTLITHSTLNSPAALVRRCLSVLTWTPPRCRWDPAKPPQFSLALNILFAFAGAFTVANLYYNHPILNVLADEFHISYEKASQIPTVMQAGYATGLILLNPMGDMLKRRPFTLCLVFGTATLWLGLCITKNFQVFSGISFVVSVTTVTPQIMLPLVGDLAPPHRRALSLSIVVSGFLLGILVARVLSGTLTNFTSWRNIYWLSLGLQYTIFLLLWNFMPDYPPTNPLSSAREFLKRYPSMLFSILQLMWRNPVLVQSCFIAFFAASPFTCYWTTVTFLLVGSPYHYSSLIVGLFGLIGIGALCVGPIYARLVIDPHVPLFSVMMGQLISLVGICIGTYTGKFTVAGPIIQAFLLDWGLQSSQVANRSAIYSIAPNARNRVNTAFMVFVFCGQLTGTAAGNRLYARGGWILSGSYSVACIGVALFFCVLRGPWEERWVGWKGGWSIKKKNKLSADGKSTESALHTRKEDTGQADGGTPVGTPQRESSEDEKGGDAEKGLHA